MPPIFLWELKIIAYRGNFSIPSSSKLELLCQCGMTSWYYIVTKSSIVDNLSVRDPTKRLKFNQVNIYIFKVKKKSTKIRFEICPKLTIKAAKWRKFYLSGVFIVNFVLCNFSILTLNNWMPVGTCCIHFHMYRSSHPEVFFKKGVIRIVRQFTKEHPYKRSTWVFPCIYVRTCSWKPFWVKTSEELLMYIALNREIINLCRSSF